MLSKKDILVQLAQNVDLNKLAKFGYHTKEVGNMILAIDEFINVLSQCQEVKYDN